MAFYVSGLSVRDAIDFEQARITDAVLGCVIIQLR